jgi:xanthine dehydrogenase accessory factor
MRGFFAALADWERTGTPFVLMTLLDAQGSTPRQAGTKMAVSAAKVLGTIGGGALEFEAIALGRELLLKRASRPVTRKWPLGPTLGQCCGGSVTVSFEPILPPALTLALFGAGHVARALVEVLGPLPHRIDWIDARPDEFPETLPPQVAVHVTPHAAAIIPSLPAGCFVLVMTHDHALDLDITAAALTRADLPYVGLIGSATKKARFLKRLAAIGLAEAAAARLVCPIGLPNTGGKDPREIAIATAAQLLQIAGGAPIPAVGFPETEDQDHDRFES